MFPMDSGEATKMASSEHSIAVTGQNSFCSSLTNHSMASPSPVGMIPNMKLPCNSVSSTGLKAGDSFNATPFNVDATSEMGIGGFNTSDPTKKKRGRPRKYGSDGCMALALTPMSSASGYSNSPSTDPSAIKRKGRPPGSGKKQQLDALGSAGLAFTPHVITVKAGEDIASKIMAFSQQGSRTVCILSASGAICNVTLRQPATSGGTVTYEGRFEIISLSGSFLLTECDGTRSRTGGLSVSLAGSDGRILGGVVAGMLMAANAVQVVVASFIADGKKRKAPSVKRYTPSVPLQMASPGAMAMGGPPSDGTTSESSEGPNSPLNHRVGHTGQSMESAPSYAQSGWASSNSGNQQRHEMNKVFPN